MLDHPKVAAGLSISGVFELAPLRDSPHVNDKVKLTEVEIESLSPIRLPGVNKPLAIAYGTSELPAMIGSSRNFHAYRSQSHLPGPLIPIVKTNHFTVLDETEIAEWQPDMRRRSSRRGQRSIRFRVLELEPVRLSARPVRRT